MEEWLRIVSMVGLVEGLRAMLHARRTITQGHVAIAADLILGHLRAVANFSGAVAEALDRYAANDLSDIDLAFLAEARGELGESASLVRSLIRQADVPAYVRNTVHSAMTAIINLDPAPTAKDVQLSEIASSQEPELRRCLKVLELQMRTLAPGVRRRIDRIRHRRWYRQVTDQGLHLDDLTLNGRTRVSQP